MAAPSGSGPDQSAQHPAPVKHRKSEEETGETHFQPKVYLEWEWDSELYLPAENMHRTKGKRGVKKEREKDQNI